MRLSLIFLFLAACTSNHSGKSSAPAAPVKRAPPGPPQPISWTG